MIKGKHGHGFVAGEVIKLAKQTRKVNKQEV